VYGLTVAQERDHNDVFVSERERGLARQLRIELGPQGKLTYRVMRTFLFDTSFDLLDESGVPYAWTPCREAVQEEPQSEGLVVDTVNDVLYVAFETIGLYPIPLRSLPELVRVGAGQLIEPVKSFGRAYFAVPDDDEFSCEYGPGGLPEPGTIVAAGSDVHAGEFLEADLEGLSILASLRGEALMLASSQGDSSFHFYRIKEQARHLGSFLVEGVGDTDGVAYLPVPLGRRYPLGLLVVQNGEAPEPPDTGDVNGYEFDGATQFKYLSFLDTLIALR
jgi:3-phytase